MKINRNCLNCGEPFHPRKYQVDHGAGIFCSQQCYGKYNSGERCYFVKHPLTKEQLAKSLATKLRNGSIKSGRDNHKFKEQSLRDGYLYITDENCKKVPEHRKVAAEKIGRPLTTDEIVHHINGDRRDNRPENIAVIDRAAHIKIHYKEITKNRQSRRGSCHPHSKLTELDVMLIRKSTLSRRELSKMFSVSKVTIDYIIKRQTWKHI